MNSMTEGQYERLARWLDGEDVQLTEAERIAADSIRRDETDLYGRLDAAPRRGAMARARRRMTASLAHPSTGTRWRHYAIRAAASVGAAVLVAAVLLRPTVTDDTLKGIASAVSLDAWYNVVQDSVIVDEIDLIGDELDELEADVLTSLPPSLQEMELDAIEQQVEELLLEDVPDEMM